MPQCPLLTQSGHRDPCLQPRPSHLSMRKGRPDRMSSSEAGGDMRRREFIAVIGGTAAWPFAAHAQQQDDVRRIGVLVTAAADDPEGQTILAAFKETLQQLGWSEGKNLRI